jgi:hypothetical protein
MDGTNSLRQFGFKVSRYFLDFLKTGNPSLSWPARKGTASVWNFHNYLKLYARC